MSNQPNEDKDDEGKSTDSRNDEESSTDDQNREDEKEREGPGNLKRRSDWFQKRHGGG